MTQQQKMPDLKQTVAITSATVEKMSRHDMLEWVNNTVNGHYKKIEELCSGVAYCQMMDLLFPNTVGLKKVKCNPRMEHEFLHNLKLFQSAFAKLKFDKCVPIDRLIKGKFQDNFEFLQWFKKFFDTHSVGKENLKVPAAASQNPPKPIRKVGVQTLSVGSGSRKGSTAKLNTLKDAKNDKQQEKRCVSPSSLRVLQQTKEQLTARTLEAEIERNAHLKKLTEIEVILNESLNKQAYVEWSTRALAILYAVDEEYDGFAAEEGV